MTDQNMCPVCGYEMEAPPRDYNICSSCGTEFGYHDVNSTIKELRVEWLRSGARWWNSEVPKSAGWGPFQQLNRLIKDEVAIPGYR